MNSRYDNLGVSSTKSDVHSAIQFLDKGLFPNAFCKVLPDITGRSEEYCNIIHADTAGTKTSLAYMFWKESGSLEVWQNIAQDSLVMNLDDLACIGCTDQIVISSTIGRNKHLIPQEVIAEIIKGNQAFIQNLQKFDINIYYGGGETADVGDIVRTIDVGITAFARMLKKDLIINDIKPGAVIVGLSSSGQSSYENRYNSGISSNGLTAARHDILNKSYSVKYPESYAPESLHEHIYNGSYQLSDKITIDEVTYLVGDLLLSPTRTYLPVIKEILKQHSKDIQGIIHCTGGGQTKVGKFVKNVRVVKNNLFPLPPVFQLIRNSVEYSVKEMFQIFNMGHRMELYIDAAHVESIIDIVKQFQIEAQVIGQVEAHTNTEIIIEFEDQIYTF